jgi:hypothetical protein
MIPGRFAKVFASLWEGTLYGNGDAQLVFVFLLAHCDAKGIVERTPQVVAGATGLTLERVRVALELLEAPDPESRSDAEEGRRIVRLHAHRAWGWRVVNFAAYRANLDADARREEARVRMATLRAKPANEGELVRNVRTGSHKTEVRSQKSEESTTLLPSVGGGAGPVPGPGSAPDGSSDGDGSASTAAPGERNRPVLLLEAPEAGSESRPGPRGAAWTAEAIGSIVGTYALPVRGRVVWLAGPALVKAWADAFPEQDLAAQFARMRSYLASEPGKVKTSRGVAAFVNRWLGRNADRGAGSSGGRGEPRRGARSGPDERYMQGNAALFGNRNGGVKHE